MCSIVLNENYCSKQISLNVILYGKICLKNRYKEERYKKNTHCTNRKNTRSVNKSWVRDR